MRLPILLSVPHAGTAMPAELADLVCLSQDDVVKDGDEQAAEIYLPLRAHVTHLVNTDVARVRRRQSLPRRLPERRRHQDAYLLGVPVCKKAPGQQVIATLLEKYYCPYHKSLTDLARGRGLRVGVDCHTMAAVGPPVGPDPGRGRPAARVSDADGQACDPAWTGELARRLQAAMQGKVRVNDPFRGGYTTRHHAKEMPWLQLELSRGDVSTVEGKRVAVLHALTAWCRNIFGWQRED